MGSIEKDVQLDESASETSEAAAHLVESIALTMKLLSEAADQMRLTAAEFLSVSLFCANVKGSLRSLIGADLQKSTAAEPLLDQLYQDAHHNLSVMRRAGRQTLAAINGVEQAASTLYRLGVQLDARHMQAAVSAGNDEPARFGQGSDASGAPVDQNRMARP